MRTYFSTCNIPPTRGISNNLENSGIPAEQLAANDEEPQVIGKTPSEIENYELVIVNTRNKKYSRRPNPNPNYSDSNRY